MKETAPRTDRCPVCKRRMTTERGYRCFACTEVLAEERKLGKKGGNQQANGPTD